MRVSHLFSSVFLLVCTGAILAQSGNVGIGVDTPQARLHVVGDLLLTGVPNLGNPTPPPASGTGARMMWYLDKVAFRAGYAEGSEWDIDSIGDYSIALGNGVKAPAAKSTALGYHARAFGVFSTALGESTTASGNHSTALGVATVAAASYSTAIGFLSTASGYASTAMGYSTSASGYNTTAIGRYNVGGGNPTTWIDADPLFEIGRGTAATPANALTVLKNGNVGVGTASPQLKLHVTGGTDAGIGGGGYFQLGETNAINLVMDNNEIMVRNNGVWDPLYLNNDGGAIYLAGGSSAFVGIGTTTPGKRLDVNGGAKIDGLTFQVDEINNRVGIGANPLQARLHVEGDFLAAGSYNGANPISPPASGAGTRMMWYPDKAAFRAGYVSGANWDKDSIGGYSIGLGYSAKARGDYATALGRSTKALGLSSTSLGYITTASGDVSTAMGGSSTASGNFSTAMGSGTAASGVYSTALGNTTTASGDNSTAIGYHTTASAYAATAIGRYNVGGGNAQTWVDTDPLFEIGKGVSGGPSNALTVLKNGRVGIGPSVPNAPLHVLGEARFESASGGNKIIIDGSTALTQVEFQDDGAYGAGIGYSIDDDRIFLYHGGGNVLVKNGNLGVNVVPTHRIDVMGGAYCSGTTWTNASSRSLKENFLQVDTKEVLARLSGLPVTEWNYVSEGQHIRHMGPMAEDFHAAFGLGYDNATISTVDLAGVTVAAVQALREENERLSESNETLRSTCAKLETKQTELEAQVARLTRIVEGMATGTGGFINPR